MAVRSLITISVSTNPLVAGSTGGTYQITAVRSTRRGNPAQFNVNFGVVGGGGAFYVASATDANGQPMKMAA